MSDNWHSDCGTQVGDTSKPMASKSQSPAANGARPEDISADLNAEISTGTAATTQAQITAAVRIAIDQLASEPHDTIPGLQRRYYDRGSFVLLEHLTPRALADVERLRRRGEHEHADRLAAAWRAP